MGINLVAKALPAITFSVLSFYSQTATNSAQIKQADTQKRQVAYYPVQEKDTLLSISENVYGRKEYWTTLWSDNDWIADPGIIEIGAKLTIRTQQPSKIEALKPEFSKKLKGIQYASVSKVVLAKNVKAVSAVRSGATGSLNDAQMTFLGNCESGMRQATNTGNGFYGAFQFTIGTWNSMNTGYDRADLAPLEVQKDAVQRLLARSSIFTQFPACARKMQSGGLLVV